MKIDELDRVLRLVDREVWVITAAAGSRRGGLAATWVSQASIDRQRPVLIAGIAPNHFTADLIDESLMFAAHLLREDQAVVAYNFANGSGRGRDKLVGLELATEQPPILADCLAWCDCRVFARHETGDRVFYWADVALARQISHGPSLRDKALFSQLTPDQARQLAGDRDADIARLRPLHEQWRKRLPNLS